MINLKYMLAIIVLISIVVLIAMSVAYGIVSIDNYIHAHFTAQQIMGMSPDFTFRQE